MSRVRRKWTPEEDGILMEAVAQANRDSQPLVWHLIAQALPDRTNKDCRKRWYSKLATDVNKGPWTAAEDARLYDAVKVHGNKWVLVASQVATRNGDQCSKRWNNTMNPEIDHSSWTREEDEMLLRDVEQYGHNWTAIVSTHFVGRTPLAAKNRYYLLGRKANDTKESPKNKSAPVSPQDETRSSDSNFTPWTWQAPRTPANAQADAASGSDADSEGQISADGEGDNGVGGPGNSRPKRPRITSGPEFTFTDITGPLFSSQGARGTSMHACHNVRLTAAQRNPPYRESAVSDEFSPSFTFSKRGQTGYSPRVVGYSTPQQTEPFGTPNSEACMLDVQDYMMSNTNGLESESAGTSLGAQLVDFNNSKPYSGLPLGNFPSIAHSNPLPGPQKPCQGHQVQMASPVRLQFNRADLGDVFLNQSPTSSDQGEAGKGTARRVTITAICSADQLGDLIQAVTERTISAKFETGS